MTSRFTELKMTVLGWMSAMLCVGAQNTETRMGKITGVESTPTGGMIVQKSDAQIGSVKTPWMFVRKDGNSGFSNDFTTNSTEVVTDETGTNVCAHAAGESKILHFTLDEHGIPSKKAKEYVLRNGDPEVKEVEELLTENIDFFDMAFNLAQLSRENEFASKMSSSIYGHKADFKSWLQSEIEKEDGIKNETLLIAREGALWTAVSDSDGFKIKKYNRTGKYFYTPDDTPYIWNTNDGNSYSLECLSVDEDHDNMGGIIRDTKNTHSNIAFKVNMKNDNYYMDVKSFVFDGTTPPQCVIPPNGNLYISLEKDVYRMYGDCFASKCSCTHPITGLSFDNSNSISPKIFASLMNTNSYAVINYRCSELSYKDVTTGEKDVMRIIDNRHKDGPLLYVTPRGFRKEQE